jgi:hypothetical protein
MTSSKGQWVGQEYWDMRGQESWDRTTIAGQPQQYIWKDIRDRTVKTIQSGQVKLTDQPGQNGGDDRKDRTNMAEQPERNNRDRIVGQVREDRSA